jgi:dihydroorotase
VSSTLITNGQVLTPGGAFAPADLRVTDGVIDWVGRGETVADDAVIDAAGLYVAPGFIDMHCHVFSHPDSASQRLHADRIGVRQGVSCVVDTGSAGSQLIGDFGRHVIDKEDTRAFALCNIGSPGMPGSEGGHAARPDLIALDGTVRAIAENPDWVLGVKVLASATHTGLMGIEAVKIGRKAAELAGTPLMVHIGNAPPLVDDVLDLLRPGDIVTHAYHGKAGGVLGFGGEVIAQFRAAVERGVWVDIAHGRSSFSYATCERVLEQGMPVHTISSDLHRGNIDRYVVSLARTMSKFRALGLTLAEVVTAVAVTPARVLGLDRFGFGSLLPGTAANITIFRETDKAVAMEDASGEVRVSRHWIEPVSVMVAGKVFERAEEL